MTIEYRVYSNNNHGGPVILGAPVATVSGLTWTSPNLPGPSDTTFLVRAVDTVSGLEDPNTDARVRVQLDQDGNDIGGYPKAPIGLTARPLAGGGALVTFSSASAVSVIVPANSAVALPVGATFSLSQLNTGKVTVGTATGVTVNSLGGLVSLAGQYAKASLTKTGTDTWLLSGNLGS